MLNRIPARLSASVVALLALIVLTAVATGYYLNRNRDAALAINLMVHQATRAAAMGREAATYTPDSHADSSKRLEAMRKAFQQTHMALTEGGEAPLHDATHDVRTFEPVTNEAVLDRLNLLTAQWATMAKALDTLIAGQGKDDEARHEVLRLDRDLVANLDATAAMLQTHADEDIAQLFWIQVATTGLGFFLVLIILWASRRDIGVPLRRFVEAADRMAAGDLDSAVDTSGLAEIAEVAESLERLRKSMRRKLADEGEGRGGDDDDGDEDEVS